MQFTEKASSNPFERMGRRSPTARTRETGGDDVPSPWKRSIDVGGTAPTRGSISRIPRIGARPGRDAPHGPPPTSRTHDVGNGTQYVDMSSEILRYLAAVWGGVDSWFDQ